MRFAPICASWPYPTLVCLRELDTALPGSLASPESIPAADSVASLGDGLDRLSLKELKELCKQRRLKGITKPKKDELIALLRGGISPQSRCPASRGF